MYADVGYPLVASVRKCLGIENMQFRNWISTLVLTLALPAIAADDDTAAVRKALAELLPGVEPDSVTATPVAGLYEVAVGPRLFYISADGRYLIQGQVFDIKNRKNITEDKIAKAKKTAIDELGEQNMVIFAPEKYDHTVTVFTDIDCGYCRKLHNEMDGYNDKGIRVRYLFFPRAGVGSKSYQKAVSVWCADDRNAAMTQAKNGMPLPEKDCENPVRREMQLGQLLGVTGTPAIFLEDGQMLPGYIPPDKLKAFLTEK